jgi:hypothetical protein
LQVDQATNVVKDAYFITYVWYMLENDIKEELLLRIPVDGRA